MLDARHKANSLALIGALALFSAACRRGESQATVGSASASIAVPAEAAPEPTIGKNVVAPPMPVDRPMIGATSYTTLVFAEPRDTSKRLGYLRLGTRVPRSEAAVSEKGCKGGWYEIHPKGFVCAGADATIDLESPVLKAAAKRPDVHAALPYRYGFVRAVLPLYLRAPSAEEQEKSEFKLKEHLAWYAENRETVDKVSLGAWDVALDGRGVPVPGKALGELGQQKTSLEVGLGVHFGGESDTDPLPFWLQDGKRAIPNVSDFVVPEYAVFADRARRFTGLAFVGSFALGDDAFNRRFAITTDLRLAPTTKVKPDTGSPWHGFEITDPAILPFAFVREQGAARFNVSGNDATRGAEAEWRGLVNLTGKQKRVAGEKYYATKEGDWMRASDVGLVVAPSKFPKVAEKGEKWIEIALSEQTLVLWEGTRPVYATLISSGRREYPTVTGEFRIRNKHITATMDSNENSDVGGGAPTRVASSSDDGEKKRSGKKSDAEKGSEVIPKRGDGEYGVTKRRGEGTYALRDVPYIQYFAAGYALHAAYWHDVFGKKRSHGCINMSPIDAHRVFYWTDPPVPDGWHALNTGEEFGEGTTIVVHD